MNRDDVLRMAQQAADETADICVIPHEFSVRFAALVAAAERAECIALCDQHANTMRKLDPDCFSQETFGQYVGARGCASAIRQRAFVQPTGQPK
jgi:hypothetical protein